MSNQFLHALPIDDWLKVQNGYLPYVRQDAPPGRLHMQPQYRVSAPIEQFVNDAPTLKSIHGKEISYK